MLTVFLGTELDPALDHDLVGPSGGRYGPSPIQRARASVRMLRV
jgi:hypothetical protein